MKRSGAKIIIKPRRVQQPEPASDPEPEPSEPTTEQEVEANEDNEQLEDAPPDSDAQDGSVKDAEENNSGIESGEADSVVMTRGRGRPRGRPRGSGTGRPRGRPRGSGRGRGRPKTTGRSTLTLRLPRRGSASDGDDGADGEESRATPADDGETIPTGKVVQIGGKSYTIEGDAYVTEDNPKGDTKIDANGVLLGGRQFKAQTFILPDRHPERRYMLAIDAARTSGFRDSLYYFRRNPLALKLIASQPEKDFLIEIGKLGGHLRTRSVTLVTARSAFKLHGAKMLIDGRIGIDDYLEEKAIAEAAEKGLKAGDPASELIEQAQAATAEASAAALAKSGGGKGERSGLGIYRTGGPTTVFGGSGLGPYSDGPLHVAKKAMLTREGVSEENWMFVMAQRTRETNTEWTRGRAEAIRGIIADTNYGDTDGKGEGDDATMTRNKRSRRNNISTSYGVYEPHTTIIHYERTTQPTRARWEVVPDPDGKRRVLGGTKAGNGAWGLAWVDTIMELPDKKTEDEQERSRWNLLQSVSGQS